MTIASRDLCTTKDKCCNTGCKCKLTFTGCDGLL